MSDSGQDPTQHLSIPQRIDQICLDFEREWKAGTRPQIELFLESCPPDAYSDLLSELLALEFEYRIAGGETITVADYADLFPDHQDTIVQHLADASRETTVLVIESRCPECGTVNRLHFELKSQQTCTECGAVLPVTMSFVEEGRTTVGAVAPDFRLPCIDTDTKLARSVSLADYRGSWLAIVFYPRDFSFVCPTELTAFSERQTDFSELACQLLGVSIDPIERHLDWLRTPTAKGGISELTFPLASDVDGALATAYGAYDPQSKCCHRGLYLIDPQGILQYQVIHNQKVGRGTDEPLRVLSALQSGGFCSANWDTDNANLSLADLKPGRVISNYRIEQKIGSGGFGVVYRAHDSLLQRTVALKILPPDRLSGPVSALGEARMAASLNHPHVCTVYAIDDSMGVPMIAMEYLTGQTLRQRLNRESLSMVDVARFGRQIAAGLSAAHKQGIGHGDLKPANLIFSDSETIKILDFGLAQVARRDQSNIDRGLTGTPAYMSPEQTCGTAPNPVSDVFSLGLLLLEMLTGQNAISGDDIMDQILQIRNFEAGRLTSQIPEPFAALLKQMLVIDPEERTIRMLDIAQSL
ncbi:MAG: redoxin domain-containing protein [Planctomycetaceae bacterium]